MQISASAVKELRDITDAGMMDCKKALVEAQGDKDKAIEILRTKLAIKADKRASKTAAEGMIGLHVAKGCQQGFMFELNCETDFVSMDNNFKAFGGRLIDFIAQSQAKDPAAVLALSADNGTVDDLRQALSSKTGEKIQLRRVVSLSGEHVNGYVHGQRIGVLVSLDRPVPELAKDIAMHIAATRPQAIDEQDLDPALLAKERLIYVAQAKESGKPDNIIEKMVDGRMAKYQNEVCLVGQAFVKNPDQTVGQLLKEHGAKVLQFIRYELGEGIEKETVDFAAEVQAQLKGE